MLTGAFVLCGFVVLGVLVAAVGLVFWLRDRRESRTMLLTAIIYSGPDGARACGEAWTAIRERSPTLLGAAVNPCKSLLRRVTKRAPRSVTALSASSIAHRRD